MKPGDTSNLQDVIFEAIPAYNKRPVSLLLKAHPKSKELAGFILTLNNELRIYHAGDTDLIPEMRQLKNINVALVPVGGDNPDDLKSFRTQIDENIRIIEFGITK